jgi:Protein of unknown function (DUF5818)
LWIGSKVAVFTGATSKFSERSIMQNSRYGFCLVLIVALGTPALGVHANSQQWARQPLAAAQQQQSDAQMASSDDAQTQDAKVFSGRIVQENGQLVLKDTVANVSYNLDDQAKAKRYTGKQVKVTGQLELNSNTIHVDSIELLS